MTAFPIGANLTAAAAPDAPIARTQDAAEALSGGPVFFAEEEAPGAFKTPADAEAAFPELYGAGLYELYWRDNAWRVSLRYWRPVSAAPVARNVTAAARKPIGVARSATEAEALLGQPAERIAEMLPHFYQTRQRLMIRWGAYVDGGLASIIERENKFAVMLSYWRPVPPPGTAFALTPAERGELAERMAAPLIGKLPQAPMDVGLFEQVAPENPDIVLAEEGDGRFRGE